MREIKFRYWNKQAKKYHYGQVQVLSCLSQQTTGLYDHESDGCRFEQYTGLHDKNGREIYEGDVVCFDDSESGGDRIVYAVEFGGGTYDSGVYPFQGFYLKPETEYGWHEDHSKMFNGSLEIIGNIHENPELLA